MPRTPRSTRTTSSPPAGGPATRADTGADPAPRTYRAFWDRQARAYARRAARGEAPMVRRARTWVCTRASGDVLELAIGAGANVPYYPPTVRLTGLDLSPAMLERAAAVAADLGRRPRLVTGDAGDLPFDDASFDVVTCTFGLCCVPDVATTLRGAARVLRPGGRLLLADHVLADRAALRAVQRCVEAVTVPWHGEHLTRRPLVEVRDLGFDVRETERGRAGLLELVHAVVL